MMEGRELQEIGERLVVELGRLADANVAIVELAKQTSEEINSTQPGPPFCPHCGTFNPEVRSEGGIGKMADFVLKALCGSCGEMIFGFPEGWIVLGSEREARALLDERREPQ